MRIAACRSTWPTSGPKPYRGKLLTLNFHGRRVNVERLERSGSGYAGRHEPDILLRRRPLVPRDRPELRPRRQRVHSRLERYRRVPRARRRPPRLGPDLSSSAMADRRRVAAGDLARVERSGTGRAAPAPQRVVRAPGPARARRPRSARRRLDRRQSRRCASLFDHDADPVRKLRALWSLYVIGGADRALLCGSARSQGRVDPRLGDPPADRRAADRHVFSRRVGPDVEPSAALLAKLDSDGQDDPSGLVRLVLASTLQRLPVNRRVELASALLLARAKMPPTTTCRP